MIPIRRSILVVLLLLVSAATGFDLEKCPVTALGMESGKIDDSQITASSAFDPQSVGPQNARIRTEKNSGAWCPKTQIKNGSYEFLQLNLGQTHVIRAVETQGRFGNGTGQEFTQAYLIDYWRSGISKWIRWRGRNGATLIEGNSDTITAVQRRLDPPIFASKIRVIPYSTQTRVACLRLEIYGCEYKDGLLSYSWSKSPPSEPEQENFTDETFEETDELDSEYGTTKGLGLLTDGMIARHPPVDPIYRQPYRNGSWTGWSRNDTDGEVQLRFEFERENRFTAAELYGYGRPISNVEVDFSTDGQNYGERIEFTYPRNELVNEAENDQSTEVKEQNVENHYTIRIPLHDSPGRLVRLRLKFTNEWIFLSEIRFSTDPTNGTSLLPNFQLDSTESYGLYYIMVAVLGVLFIILTLALCVAMRRKSVAAAKIDSPEKLMVTSSIGSPSSRSTAATSTLSHHDLIMHQKSGALIATLGSKNGAGHPRHVVHSHSFAPHQQFLGQYNGSLFLPMDQRHHCIHPQRALGVGPASRSCSGTMFGGMQPSLLDINFPPPPPIQSMAPSSTASTVRADGPSNSSSEGIYAEPCSTAPLLPHRQQQSYRHPIAKPRSRDSLNRRNRTLPTRNRPAYIDSNRSYDNPANSSGTSSDLMISPNQNVQPLPTVERLDIELIERIGEGKFTQIFSCRLKDRRSGTERKVAIKQLQVDNEAARLALISEAKVAAELEHNGESISLQNLSRLLGQCEDLALLSELAENGDVRSFCQRNRVDRKERVDYARMLSFSSQIAAAMSQLERLGIVHGHLSPKCCLLDSNWQIRLASARGPNHHAQLRYSAPEAIILNSWSSHSDAFSFGVTMWELLHCCEFSPFPTLSNAELISNARNQLDQLDAAIYPNDTLNNIPDHEVSELLHDCWSSPADSRPGFHEIHVFLQRKLLTVSTAKSK
ncbi:hypothetical protein M3Y94_00711500 [Aphelenchoides besseyi]|nr:hypothetical protein M3Y94_00711500 [Aphelenchoides besseyi]KAI6231715.1 hypothetical protein M3Y95_00411000 [Aphelenchoides besseyi]